MDIVTTILGLFGGGWGTAVAVIGALVGFFILKKAWTNFKQKQAHIDSKDKHVSDHAKVIGDNQSDNANAQSAKDKANASKAKAKQEFRTP